jgi:hypothetical protein
MPLQIPIREADNRWTRRKHAWTVRARHDPREDPLTRRTLHILLWLASALAVAGFVAFAWRTLAGGAPANPLEAMMLDHASRMAQGQSPYVDSGTSGVSLMPVFPFVVSGLVRMFDAQLWEPRLVSLLAILFASVLAGMIVRFETQSLTLGAAATGLMLMSQGFATGLSEGARPEALMLLIAILGCLSLRYVPGIPGALLASVVFSAASFTHPAGLWFALAALLHLGVHDHRRSIAYSLGLAAIVGATQIGFSKLFGAWFNYVVWDAGLHAMRFDPVALLQFIGTQLLGTLGVFTFATVLSFALPIPPWRGAVGIWTWMALAGLLAGVTASQGGGELAEAGRIAAMVLAIVGPLAARRITQHLSTWPGSSRVGGQTVVLTALALQFVTLFANGAR